MRGADFARLLIRATKRLAARATKPAGQHRRHPPRRPAPAARPTLSRSPLTPASPAPRPRRNQAGRWNLSLLPHPHWPRRYRSALPCYSDRDHPGARINEKSVHEVSRVRSLETKAPVQTVDEQPGPPVRHPHLPAGLGNRAVLVDHLQQFDLAWANRAVGVEIDTQRQLRHSLNLAPDQPVGPTPSV